MEETEKKREYKNLQPLQKEYEKIQVYMETNFEKRLENLGKVSDQEDFQFELKQVEIKNNKFKSNTSSFKKSEPDSFVSVNPIPE